MELEIFEPTLCCPSGVCGPEPEKELIDLRNLIQLLAKAGIQGERYAINQPPMEFAKNPVVIDIMRTIEPSKLPLTLLEDKIMKKEDYPMLKAQAETMLEGITPEYGPQGFCHQSIKRIVGCC